MKNLLKLAAVAAFAVTLAACADDNTASTDGSTASTTTTTTTHTSAMTHEEHCQAIKNQIKMTAPDDQSTLDDLNSQLSNLNCGTK